MRNLSLICSLMLTSALLFGCARRPDAELLNADPSDRAPIPAQPVEAGFIEFTPVPGEEAFDVTGPFDLRGTLRRSDGDVSTWTLEGSMMFSTGGFSLKEPSAIMTMSIPEQVIFTIVVVAPPPGSMVTQAFEEHDFKKTIIATPEAIFRGRVLLETPAN